MLELKGEQKEITDDMLKKAIHHFYGEFDFSNRFKVTGKLLKTFYEKVFFHLRKMTNLNASKCAMTILVPEDEEPELRVSQEELFCGIKRSFGIFPDRKGRVPNYKFYEDRNFILPRPQYLGRDPQDDRQLYIEVKEGEPLYDWNNCTPRPQVQTGFKETDYTNYNKFVPDEIRRMSEDSVIRFATDQGFLKNKNSVKNGEYDPNGPMNVRRLAEERNVRLGLESGFGGLVDLSFVMGGYGKGEFDGFSTTLLNEDGSVNPFGMMGELDMDGLGMGLDYRGFPRIPNYYELDEKIIKWSKKNFGKRKQKGVWGVCWRNPGIPDGETPVVKGFATRPGLVDDN